MNFDLQLRNETCDQSAELASARLAEARRRTIAVPNGIVDPSARTTGAILQDTPEQKRAAVSTLLSTLDEVARKKQFVDEMMALLLRETRAARRKARRRLFSYLALTLAWVWLQTTTPETNWWVLFVLCGMAATDQGLSNRRNVAQKLCAARDPRAVGVLAIAVRDGDPFVSRTAETALRDLLPRVRASDGAFFDAEQMDALLSLHRHDTGLKIALLKALQQIGDERALSVLLFLQNDPMPRVREQAADCIDCVTRRLIQAHESATLLRASSRVMAPPDQLLRPASSVARTPAEEMLRPWE